MKELAAQYPFLPVFIVFGGFLIIVITLMITIAAANFTYKLIDTYLNQKKHK